MIEYYKNIESFWDLELSTHVYKRQVPFIAKNFDHLDKNFYNKDFLYQSFNDELPDCCNKFYSILGLTTATISWTCLKPNLILPTHKDTFYTLRQDHQIEIDRCFRYLIFLEDWIFGQYVGFENRNIVKWKKGDIWIFDFKEMHYAVNASNLFFHTCQVSSFK